MRPPQWTSIAPPHTHGNPINESLSATDGISPARRRACVEHVQEALPVTERRVCRIIGQHRSTQRKLPHGRPDEDALTRPIIALA